MATKTDYRICGRCEKVYPLKEYGRRRHTCYSCISKEKVLVGTYPYRRFEELPDSIQDTVSYYIEVQAKKSYISRKMGIPYIILSKWIANGDIPKFDGKIVPDTPPEDIRGERLNWSKWFLNQHPDTQLDVVTYLTAKRRAKIFEGKVPSELKQKCGKWKISVGKMRGQLAQTRCIIPTLEDYLKEME